MKRTAIPYPNAPLSLLTAEQGQTEQRKTPQAGFTADFQEMYSLAMDRAVGIEKASLDAVVQMQSCMIDAFQNAPWGSSGVSAMVPFDASFNPSSDASSDLLPALAHLFDLAAQAITSYLELQLGWLAMIAPHAIEKIETSFPVAAAPRKVAGSIRAMPHPAPHGLEHSMDIAIGARAA
jgi:hypothetical protein